MNKEKNINIISVMFLILGIIAYDKSPIVSLFLWVLSVLIVVTSTFSKMKESPLEK